LNAASGMVDCWRHYSRPIISQDRHAADLVAFLDPLISHIVALVEPLHGAGTILDHVFHATMVGRIGILRFRTAFLPCWNFDIETFFVSFHELVGTALLIELYALGMVDQTSVSCWPFFAPVHLGNLILRGVGKGLDAFKPAAFVIDAWITPVENVITFLESAFSHVEGFADMFHVSRAKLLVPGLNEKALFVPLYNVGVQRDTAVFRGQPANFIFFGFEGAPLWAPFSRFFGCILVRHVECLVGFTDANCPSSVKSGQAFRSCCLGYGDMLFRRHWELEAHMFNASVDDQHSRS